MEAFNIVFDGEAMLMSAKGACRVYSMPKDLAVSLRVLILFLLSSWIPSSKTSMVRVFIVPKRLTMRLNGSPKQ